MARPKAVSLNPVCLYHGVSGLLPAPFQDILWCVDCFCSETHIYVTYAGSPEGLVAAGCGTIELLAPYQKGQRVLDVDGDPVHREFRRGWLRLTRTKPVAAALQLPGVTLDAIRVAKANFARGRTDLNWPDLSAYDRPRPQLRLVVDNTR